MTVNFGELTDKSQYYKAKIKALKKETLRGKDLKSTLSFEIFHIKNPLDIRSFRTDSIVDQKTLILGQISAMGFCMIDSGYFSEIDGKDKLLKGITFTQAVEDQFYDFVKRAKQAFYDGMKKWEEDKQ